MVFFFFDDRRDFVLFIDPDWQLVFKAVSEIPGEPVNNGEFDSNDLGKLWERPQALNEDKPEARQLNSAYKGHFKSSFVFSSESYRIDKVCIELWVII